METRNELVADLTGIGIELGVAGGSFSSKILEVSKLSRLYSVDRWAGDRGHGIAECRYASELLARHGERSIVLRATFDEALDAFGNEHFDFIYIDGYAHTGQDGGSTLDQWWPKLKQGGLFAGHDYDAKMWPETYKEVNKFVEKKNLNLNITEEATEPSWYLTKS
jgi:predicted O-methyltransferase YrrM